MLVKELLNRLKNFPHAVFINQEYDCRGCAYAAKAWGYLKDNDGKEKLLSECGDKIVESFHGSFDHEKVIMWINIERD